MSNEKRISDSTVARIAGNIAAGLLRDDPDVWERDAWIAEDQGDDMVEECALAEIAVKMARAIVAEVERTAKSEP